MAACFPLAITSDQIGNQVVQDFNASIPVTYINPTTGQSVQITVECDSGAFISLAPASLAQILGLDLVTGATITLQGVGGSQILAYIHQVNIQIGSDIYQGVTIAIAAQEGIPFLLGRVNFWDMASISIDNLARTVCFTQISPGVPAGPAPPGAVTYPYPTDYLWAIGAYGIVAGLLVFSGGYDEILGRKGRHKKRY